MEDQQSQSDQRFEEKKRLKQEADDILHACSSSLDAFHLLGVVADDRTSESFLDAVFDDLYALTVASEEIPSSPFAHEIDTASVQRYLQDNAQVGQAFERIVREASDDTASSEQQQAPAMSRAVEVPDIFFSPTFDLTDSQTFAELLLLPAAATRTETTTVMDCLGLKSPDALKGHLESIEMALLSQVRANSANFFAESQRFAELETNIQSLLSLVLNQSTIVENLDGNLPAQTIIAAEEERNMLQTLDEVLQILEDLYVCKHGLGGVLASDTDDVTGVSQIQYAQKLLDSVEHLHAVSNIQDQLQKYEQLVIQNLRDELLELCLHRWDKARAVELLVALQAVDAVPTVTAAYTARSQDTIRMTVRTVVAEFSTEVASSGGASHPSVASGVNSMSIQRFLDCLDMLMEQIVESLSTIQRVNAFFNEQNLPSVIAPVLVAAAELSSKSMSELLRVRKEAHSLLTLEEMKQVWGRCSIFCEQIETISGTNTSNLRSTLLAQTKAFLERRHETNMSALAAALDSERWVQCEVSSERQEAMTRLSTGRAQSTAKRSENSSKAPELEVNGYRYKVVWSCLLLLEMISNNLATSAFFPNLATSCVAKLGEILRLFNARTTQLVLGAGAMHSHAKLKSINAKHLSLVTQCLGVVMEVLPHVRGTLMAQLPRQQHTLLTSLDQVRTEYGEHNEKVLNKLVSIIGGLVERGLSKRIPGTDFDERAKIENLTCCNFLEEVASHTRRMHQVIKTLLHPDHLIDTFSKIFAFLDTKVPALIIEAGDRQQVFQRQDTNRTAPVFSFPRTEAGKRRLLLEVQELTRLLNELEGVRPWDFTAVQILEKALEYSLTESESLASEDPVGSDDERSHALGDSSVDDTVENGTLKEENAEEQDPIAQKEENGATDESNVPSASVDTTSTPDSGGS